MQEMFAARDLQPKTPLTAFMLQETDEEVQRWLGHWQKRVYKPGEKDVLFLWNMSVSRRACFSADGVVAFLKQKNGSGSLDT